MIRVKISCFGYITKLIAAQALVNSFLLDKPADFFLEKRR